MKGLGQEALCSHVAKVEVEVEVEVGQDPLDSRLGAAQLCLTYAQDCCTKGYC